MSVFLGGGTPSLFPPEAIGRVLQAARRHLSLAADVEVTLEARPDVLKRLHPGQAGTVMVLDIPNMGLPGAVKEIKETEVIVEFQNTLLGVKPGMRADVRFRFE